MKFKIIHAIGIVQSLYFYMFFGNGAGKLNMILNDLGYIVWGIFAIVSLVLSIFFFYKTRKATSILLSIISCLEIGFVIFIWILPSIVGIPFD